MLMANGKYAPKGKRRVVNPNNNLDAFIKLKEDYLKYPKKIESSKGINNKKVNQRNYRIKSRSRRRNNSK